MLGRKTRAAVKAALKDATFSQRAVVAAEARRVAAQEQAQLKGWTLKDAYAAVKRLLLRC